MKTGKGRGNAALFVWRMKERRGHAPPTLARLRGGLRKGPACGRGPASACARPWGPMAGAPALPLPANGQGPFPPYVIAGPDPAIHSSHAHHPAGRAAGAGSGNTDERR
ncbi:hypothetical protein MTBUT4_250007 [Magnetospirillum sp. UT-4]|nr:hypothetical protein MTBUT4_250007 [Magnetospirillum sp. UT-4]